MHFEKNFEKQLNWPTWVVCEWAWT